MTFNWQIKRFGDCADLIRNTVLPEEFEGEPYIGLEHIEEGTLRLMEIGKSSDVVSVKSRFESGDILFGKLRPYFRKVVRPSFSGVCSTDIWVVRAKPSIDQGYLYYWMASQEFVDMATQASEGTKMPRAKWDFLERAEKSVPPLPVQRAIAHILGTLDDKIELNRRMNQTLEEIAQALFKNWFVDFEPFRDGGMQDSPLGEIPVGWRVTTLSKLGEIVCGKTPPTADIENYGGNIPFITIPDMHNKVFVTRTATYLSETGAATQPKKLLPKNSVCVSCIATPGLVAITSEPSHTNQQINSIICDTETSAYWCYLAICNIRQDIITGGAGGSATLNLNKAEFSKLQVVRPDNETMKKIHNLVKPLFDQILQNDLEVIILVDIRDTLLPKLLSGEIRVKDAEKFVEAKL
jgi:type I restriction enzyme S subunit